MLSRFHLIPERNGRTDRQICYINIARQYADARQKSTLTLFPCGRLSWLPVSFFTAHYRIVSYRNKLCKRVRLYV